MPSALLASEVEKLHDDQSGNELANICLGHVLDATKEETPKFDLLEMCYPIVNWEKPDKRKADGIPTEKMDEWVIDILKDWGVLRGRQVFGLSELDSKSRLVRIARGGFFALCVCYWTKANVS